MVVPVDEVLNFRDIPKSMPTETPLAMPTQRFDQWAPGSALAVGPAKLETRLARLFVFSLTLAITAIGTYEMYQVISPSGATRLQFVFAGLFAITFAWIAFACASAVLGFFRMLWRPHQQIALAPLSKAGRIALLMPVYNESPERVLSALEIMARSLISHGAGRAFDIFILSDTRESRIAASRKSEPRRSKPGSPGGSASFTGGAPRTSTRRPATSPTSSPAGVVPMNRWWSSTPTATWTARR